MSSRWYEVWVPQFWQSLSAVFFAVAFSLLLAGFGWRRFIPGLLICFVAAMVGALVIGALSLATGFPPLVAVGGFIGVFYGHLVAGLLAFVFFFLLVLVKMIRAKWGFGRRSPRSVTMLLG